MPSTATRNAITRGRVSGSRHERGRPGEQHERNRIVAAEMLDLGVVASQMTLEHALAFVREEGQR